jgi:hypothetical protein
MVLAYVLRPPTFTTRRAAIGYVLEQRGITYEQVYIDRSWPDSVNTIAYSANLIIVLREQREVPGYLSCRNSDRDCTINVQRLGIDRVSIPDLTQQRRVPLLEWLEARAADLRAGRLP